jgi:hypothetical protein
MNKISCKELLEIDWLQTSSQIKVNRKSSTTEGEWGYWNSWTQYRLPPTSATIVLEQSVYPWKVLKNRTQFNFFEGSNLILWILANGINQVMIMTKDLEASSQARWFHLAYRITECEWEPGKTWWYQPGHEILFHKRKFHKSTLKVPGVLVPAKPKPAKQEWKS